MRKVTLECTNPRLSNILPYGCNDCWTLASNNHYIRTDVGLMEAPKILKTVGLI